MGKGVIIAEDREAGKEALKGMMVEKLFGNAGNQVVIEEFLTGTEVTVLAFTDGKTIKPMVSSQDHKRAYDGDGGPILEVWGLFPPAGSTLQILKRS